MHAEAFSFWHMGRDVSGLALMPGERACFTLSQARACAMLRRNDGSDVIGRLTVLP